MKEMTAKTECLTFDVTVCDAVVNFTFRPLVLRMRSSFATAHSRTTERSNAYLSIRLSRGEPNNSGAASIVGQGEVGLPPLKPGCYEADLPRLRSTMDEFRSFCGMKADSADRSYDPFSRISDSYFPELRGSSKPAKSPFEPSIRGLFQLLDLFLDPKRSGRLTQAWDRVFNCLIECALLDALGKSRGRPLCELIGRPFVPNNNSYVPRSFCVLGLGPVEEVLENLPRALKHTPLIKLKADSDASRTGQLLSKIVERLSKEAPCHFKLAVDSNGSWTTPEIALRQLEAIKPFASHFVAIEQPFPLFLAGKPLESSDIKDWQPVTKAFSKAGLEVFADESASTMEDVEKLLPIIHGVVLKLEKTGGIRGALDVLDYCHAHDLKTWISTMVGSLLNSTMAAHLVPFAEPVKWGDLDGALLTEDCGFRGGLSIGGEGGAMSLDCTQGGFGVEAPINEEAQNLQQI